MTDLEKALAKIEEGAGEIRAKYGLEAAEIEAIVAGIRKEQRTDTIGDEIDYGGRAA